MATTTDLQPIDRLEEKLKLLVGMIDLARANPVDDRHRFRRRLDVQLLLQLAAAGFELAQRGGPVEDARAFALGLREQVGEHLGADSR